MKTKQEADQYLKDYIKEQINHSLRPSEIKDFDLTGSETEEEIELYAKDYISDCETDEAEYRVTKQSNF